MKDAEKRGTDRVAKGFLVHYRGAGSKGWGLSRLKDLSLTGLRFIGEESYPKGTPLELRLQLPTVARAIDVCGAIIWQRTCAWGGGAWREYGVRFDELPSRARQDIERAIEAAAPARP